VRGREIWDSRSIGKLWDTGPPYLKGEALGCSVVSHGMNPYTIFGSH